MPMLDSFTVDHTKMPAPAVRVAKTMKTPSGDVITVFDLRFYRPNINLMGGEGIHTLEHLFAGFIRDHLNSETVEIIEQLGNPDKAPNNYIFPILNDELTAKERKKLVAQHIQTTNKYMKRIATKLGINPKISTYYARHSYSTIIRDSGASTEFIAEQLGHQSTKVTQSYLDSFPKESKKKFQQSIIPK